MSESIERVNIASGSPWEPLRGYSRAVLAGNQLFISGTTAMSASGEIIGNNDAYEQTRAVIKVIKEVLSTAGFAMSDIVRTRLFVTNIAKWEEYARAHSEAFDTIRPASSIVQVSRLVDPRLLIEMEVEALRGCKLVKSAKIAS
jgi:enamine deaminase RidA (YjgF/YER057c/UK114 family)